MEGELKETEGAAPSQFDWEKFWGETPFRGSRLGERGWHLIAEYSSRSCLRLLKEVGGVGTILELGGGSGCVSGVVARKLGLESKALTLIDNSPEAKRAWKQLSGFGKYIQGDFFTNDFEGRRFDLVFSDGLVEHWPDREERLGVIRRHAELSTRYVMIRVPKRGLGTRLLRIREGMKKDGSYEKHYTPEELRQGISDAGLKVLGVDEDVYATVALAERI